MNTNLYDSGYFCKQIDTEVYFDRYENQDSFRLMKTLSERVAFKMKALGIKQPRLAKLCGVSQPSINRMLQGGTQNPPYIYELSKALETSVRWLKTGVEDAAQEVSIARAVGDSVIKCSKPMGHTSPEQEAAALLPQILLTSPDTQRILAGWLNNQINASSGETAKSKKNNQKVYIKKGKT